MNMNKITLLSFKMLLSSLITRFELSTPNSLFFFVLFLAQRLRVGLKLDFRFVILVILHGVLIDLV